MTAGFTRGDNPSLRKRQRSIFSAVERRWLAALADAIIPPTNTPGAAAAGVPQFIERALRREAETPKLVDGFRDGIAAIDARCSEAFGTRFDRLSAQDQAIILTQLSSDSSSAAGAFFYTIRRMTIEGYYTSRLGLTSELEWSLPASRIFVGCTHSEHLW